MKVILHDKVTEADDIQNGNGENGNSQETNTETQNTETNTDTRELDKQVVQLMNRKNALRNAYTIDLKVFNDQIAALQKQKADIEAVQTDNSETIKANNDRVANINAQLLDLVNKKVLRRTTYNTDVKNVDNQLILINREIAENGGNININFIDESERARVRFGRKLFEAVMNRTDEMYAAIKLAFDQIDNLSYSPDNTQCKTFAKNTIAYLNRIGWESGENEKNFRTFMYGLLNASHLSFSNNEKDKFVENIVNIMKDNTLFSWVFLKQSEK